ncbi:tape measure protein [Elstera litoralis]|nr:tape measure protein [Elstera litoralis]
MGRFTALSGSARGAQEAYDGLYKSALQTGAGIKDSADSFTRFSIAAKEIGGTRAEVLQLVDTITKFGVVSGVSTQEASAGARQLGQALASGKLQGDELRSILENMPLLGQALARELGVGIGELRKMGEEGKLTADKVFPALLRASKQANEQFAQMPLTMERAGGQLATAWDGFAAKLDKAVGLSERLAKAIGYAASLVDGAGGFVEKIATPGVSDQIAQAEKQLKALQDRAKETDDVQRRMADASVANTPGRGRAPVDPIQQQLADAQKRLDALRALKKEEEALGREERGIEQGDARAQAGASRRKQIQDEAAALRQDLIPAVKAKAELDKEMARIAASEGKGGLTSAQAAELRAAAEKKYQEAVDKSTGAAKTGKDAQREIAAAISDAANAAESAQKSMAGFFERFDEKPLSEGRKLLVDYDQEVEKLRTSLEGLMGQYAQTSKGHKDYGDLLAAIGQTETALAEATARRAEIAERAAKIDAERLAAAYETVTTLEAEALATAGGATSLAAYNRTKTEAALRARVFKEVLEAETKQLGDVEEATKRANAAADRAVTADRTLEAGRKQAAEQQKFAQENTRIAERFSDQLADGIMDAFESGGRAGKSMFDTLASLGKQALRAALSTAITEGLRGTATDVIGAVRGAVGAGGSSGAAGGSSSGGISGIFDKITGGIGNGTSAGGGITGGLNSWLFGSAGSGNALNPASYVPGTSGVLGSGGGAFGSSSLNIGTIGNVAGLAMSAFNFAQKPTIGSGLGLVGSGMGALSALGMISPAFGPIGMGVSLVASLLGGMGNKVKHPGMGIEIMNGAEGLSLGKVTGKHMDTSGATPMGQAAIDAINATVKSMTGGSVGAGTGGQVYGISYDASGGKQRFRAVGEGLSESTEYQTVAEAISAVTVSALKNLPLTGVADNVATALKKSTATSLEGIKADLDFAKGFADSMTLLKSGLDPMKSQAAEIAKNAKDAAAGLQAWGTQFRDKAVGLGQATAEEVNAALRSMMDGALGLTKAVEPLSGYALAFEQAKANIAALKDVLLDFGLTAEQTAAKLAAATEAARVKLVGDQNAGLSREIQGLTDPRAAALADLEKWKAQAIAEAKAIGNQQGIALIEQLFGLKQQAIVEQYANRINGLTEAQQRASDAMAQMVADLQSRALGVRQQDRERSLFDFDQRAAAQLAAAPAGTQADLQRVLAGERAQLEFQGYQRDLLEALDRQIRGVQDQKASVDAQISAIKTQTAALDGLRDSLEKFQQDLKLDAGLSILSTGQRRGEAMSRMDALYTRGMAGDIEALREWEPLARQFLAISKEYNASTPGYVADYTKVQGQLDGALGKIKTPLQVAEAQLATLEAQSKQFDTQIELLQQQREEVARTGERQLASINTLTSGMMESLARWTAAQSDLATGFNALAAAVTAGKSAAAAAANSNRPAVGSDGRPVGLLGGGLDVVGQDNTTYSEWSQEKKDAWARLAQNVGFSQDIYFRTGQDFMNNGGASRADGGGFNFVGASGKIYSGYDEWKSTMANSDRVFSEFLQANNLTMDEALRQAAAGKFDPANILIAEKANGMATGGIIPGYAKGGAVGNGVWGVDSVRARYAGGGDIALAGGEFVITAPSVNQNTLPFLQSINSTGRLPTVPPRPVYRPAPAAGAGGDAAVVAAVDRLAQKFDGLVDVIAASGDQSLEALQGVRSAMGAVALATNKQKLVAGR